MTWLTTFPQLKSTWLRDLQRLIDDGFRSFTRSYGDLIEGFFS
ncbi:proline/glycine betaine ABC transporter permease, partial [Paracoccus pantotrophus]